VFTRGRDQRFPTEIGEPVYGVSDSERSWIDAGFLGNVRTIAALQSGWHKVVRGHSEILAREIDRFGQEHASN